MRFFQPNLDFKFFDISCPNYCRNHSEIVFARVSPQQKLVIVEGFQRLGKVMNNLKLALTVFKIMS